MMNLSQVSRSSGPPEPEITPLACYICLMWRDEEGEIADLFFVHVDWILSHHAIHPPSPLTLHIIPSGDGNPYTAQLRALREGLSWN